MIQVGNFRIQVGIFANDTHWSYKIKYLIEKTIYV